VFIKHGLTMSPADAWLVAVKSNAPWGMARARKTSESLPIKCVGLRGTRGKSNEYVSMVRPSGC